MSTSQVSSVALPRSRARWMVLALMMLVTAVNLGDRGNLSIAGPALSKELGISSIQMGYAFSAFAWAYVLGQLPAGWVLDRFNSIKVYGVALFTWSLFTFLQGFIGFAPVGYAVAALFALRFLVGFIEAPIYPANTYLTTAWFPRQERGIATSLFNSSQYLAIMLFTPIMGALSHNFGWHYVFWFMGGFGMLLAFVWARVMTTPDKHRLCNKEELAYLAENGASIDIEASKRKRSSVPIGTALGVLLKSRMMIGIYIGQYCITALQYFFMTWFPMYLIKGRGMDILHVGMVAALPAVCGLMGGVLGGFISDRIIAAGGSVTLARKVPFVTGMSLAAMVLFANFTDSTTIIIALMCVMLFGKGLAQIGFAVVIDTAPPQIVGVAGALFGVAGNISGIITPITIGYLFAATHSFSGAIVFVAAHGVVAALSYLLLVGKLKQLSLPNRIAA
jgi:D-galactonate transporter